MTFRFPPLNLITLAGLTPEEFEVSLTDENVGPIDFNKEIDLVAISAMTPLAPRAYEIADRFREKGIKVVLGGMHPSALPDEAIGHADSVAIGEAEGIWLNLLSDLRAGNLQKFYRSAAKPPLTKLPIPRRDLLRKKAYFNVNTIQVTRGCPFDCDFCSVTNFFGKIHRFRPVEEILKEIETLKGNIVFFLDANIVGNPGYAKELFRRLIPYKIKWMSQASINLAQDRELLQLCAKSGCMMMFIGFESLSQINLQEMRKPFNKVGRFKESIEMIHDHGIAIEGSFMFGFDNDDSSIFKKTVDFVNEVNLDAVQFSVVTPLPGTGLYQKLEREGRIIERDWSRYDFLTVVFKPRLMSEEELQNGLYFAYHQIYSYRSIFKRIFRSRKSPLFSAVMNWGFRQASKMLPL